jgi:transcriptional regulator with XRE-family HTH domain
MTLKEYLKKYNLTQQQFADRIGVKQGTVAKWVRNNKIPQTKYVILIIQETNCEVMPNDFVGGIYDGKVRSDDRRLPASYRKA